MIVRCRKCKNSDIEAAYPLKRSEELLAYVAPLTPYQCENCGRFLSWASPIMDRKRTIAAGVIVGIFFLFVIIAAFGDPEPMGIKAKPSPETTTAETQPDPQPTNDQIDKPSDEISITDSATTQNDTTSGSDEHANAAEPTAEVNDHANLEQAELSISQEEQVQSSLSPRVLEQRRRNQAKERAMLEQGTASKGETPTVQNPTAAAASKTAPAAPSKAAEGPVTPLVSTPPTNNSPTPAPSKKSVTEKATAQYLNEMSITAEGNSLMIRLIGSGAMQPTGFLASGNRYVVDLPGQWKKDRKIQDKLIDHPLVKGIRLGLHDDKLRLVFDLKAAKITAAFTQADQGLLIQLMP